MMRSVPLNLGALALAFEEPAGKSENFLDTHTGRILKINYARMWDEEIAATRLLVGADRGGRYVAIPRLDARVIVRDMADFARTVTDARVRKALQHALIGHRRHHNFRAILEHYTPERMRWYAFKDARMRERVVKWMNEVGIELAESA